MRPYRLLCILLIAASAGSRGADAQTATAAAPTRDCSGEHHRDFDFWIGDWTVTERKNPAGQNRIEKILDGCALLENWSGVDGHVGKSLNFYDVRRNVWHQTWIDHRGLALLLDGKFADGKMTLIGTRVNPKTKVTNTHRITWTPLPSGEVHQVWDSTSDGRTWTVVFDGLYARKP